MVSLLVAFCVQGWESQRITKAKVLQQRCGFVGSASPLLDPGFLFWLVKEAFGYAILRG
jgi:hypothetical protein